MGKHKEWRKYAKKARRKTVRQRKAQQRYVEEENARLRREHSPSYHAWLAEFEKLEEYQQQEETRLRLVEHEKWLKEEELAKQRWKELQIKLHNAREERVKQTARIREEWEREQKKLKELKELKEKEEEEKSKKEEELQTQINDFVQNCGDVPEGLQRNYETNPMKPTCPFFSKTGACRFKDACTRNHIRPGISRILVIPNFYLHYSLQQTESEYGNDSSLEYDSSETYEHFKEFFFDVLPEMEKCGTVRQFKVCCNQEIHLRGNVYVEYSTLRETVVSYKTFQGRWYGGRQLNVEFCNIESWKSAICGLFARHRCPKGSACNFLHVFHNPGRMFTNADRDLHRTPQEEPEDSFDTEDRRNWRWSESPEPFPHLSNSDNKKYNDKGRRQPYRNTTSRHRKDYKHRSRSKERYKKHKSSDRGPREHARSPVHRHK